MKDKEKQIEETAKEMEKELCSYYDKQKRKCTNCFGMEEYCDLHCNFGRTLERLSNAGYQKVDKDKQIVLSREEYEKLKLFEERVRSGVCFTQKEWVDYCQKDSNERTSLLIKAKKDTRKETAEKILKDCLKELKEEV